MSENRSSAGSVVMIVLGSLIGLIALALLAGGGGVIWADHAKKDSAGYFTTNDHRFELRGGNGRDGNRSGEQLDDHRQRNERHERERINRHDRPVAVGDQSKPEQQHELQHEQQQHDLEQQHGLRLDVDNAEQQHFDGVDDEQLDDEWECRRGNSRHASPSHAKGLDR